MVKVAGDVMRREGFDFVFTGEVLNERPMSQNRQSLRLVEKQSACEGYLLRPLSARLLDETVPEKEGKVDRARLLDLHGRSRKPQMALAKKYGVKDYPTPAGGCLLTDPGFSQRLRELRDHEGLGDVALIQLLKVGRHFRLRSEKKIVVGRNQPENTRIRELVRRGDMLITPKGVPGPTVLIVGECTDEDRFDASRVCARYSDAKPGAMVTVACERDGEKSSIQVCCPSPDALGLKSV
jgi:tRNA U34 2-thiouridine synthase MnmA/TrmU